MLSISSKWSFVEGAGIKMIKSTLGKKIIFLGNTAKNGR
jgi:hypothetical protein